MSMQIHQIARICHEANRAYCLEIGDASQKMWEDAPEWQRASAELGVKFIRDNNAPPSVSHESWLKEKERDGWKYGAIKDPAKKEHPCFMPYDQLPPEQRRKDHIFCAIARACLAEIG